MTNRWFVVVNPISGGGKGLGDFPKISHLLRENGIKHDPAFTEHRYHATELAVEAVNRGYRKIIVVGGDGTLTGARIFAQESTGSYRRRYRQRLGAYIRYSTQLYNSHSRHKGGQDLLAGRGQGNLHRIEVRADSLYGECGWSGFRRLCYTDLQPSEVEGIQGQVALPIQPSQGLFLGKACGYNHRSRWQCNLQQPTLLVGSGYLSLQWRWYSAVASSRSK